MRKNTQANEPSRTVVLLITALVLVGFSGIATFAAAGPSAPASHSSGLHAAASSSSSCPGPTINDVGAAASATYGTTPLNVSFYPVSPGDVFVVSAESEYPTTYTLGDSGDYFTHDTSVAIGYDYWDTWNATTTKSGLVTLTLTPSTSMAATMIAWWVTPLGPVSVSVGTVAQGGSPVSSSAPSAACGLALGDWATLDAVDYVTSPAGWVSGTTSALGFAMDRIGGNWTYVGAGGTITFDPSFSLATADYNYAQVVTLSPLSSPVPAAPTASAIAVSNSEVDLIWNDSSTFVGSDHATLNEYSGASCSGSGTAVDVQTGNWGFQNFTALTPATVYSFNVTITDSGGTSAASACAAATTRAQTLDPFGAVAQGNTTISLPTVAGQRIILLEGISDALPGDSQGNSWSYVQDGNTGNDALWTAVTATTGTDVITTGTSPPSVPYTGGWAVAVSGELKTIVASGQAGAGVIGDPYWAKLPAQAENTVAVFTEPVSGGQNESCQFTVPVGVPLSCTPILAGAYGDHRPAWRFPAFVYDVPAGIAPVVSGNLTAYGNTLNSRYVPVFDFFWVELAWPVPAAPTGLTATPVSSTVVDLAWTNPAGPLTGNNVTEWAGSGCTGGPLDTFAMAPGTVAVRGSLAVGTTYSYSVTASNVSGVGANSACADATTFDSPPAPTDLVATPYNTTQIDLTWVNPVGPLDDLNVTTYAGSGCVYGDDITNAILGVITAYDWTGLVPNSPYSFTVNAENSTGWSAPSDCASATTPPVLPTLTVANVTFYSFNESWTAGNWTNVTGAYLVLTFNASICGSVVWGDTTNSYWTWAVYTGGGEVNKTVSLVNYEFNFTRAFNLTFGPGETVYVGLVIETSGGDHPTAFSCQAVAFTPAPPPGPCQGATCNIFPLIMLGVVAGVIIFAVTVPKYDFWRKERQRGMGGKE